MKKLEPINDMFGVSTVHRETITQQFDIIRVYFTDEGIGGTSQHINEIEAIRSAGPHDVLEINVAGNPGGSADCIMTIINALIETPAHTVCILSGTNSSAATMIPLVCSEVVVTPYTAMMCHSVSGGSYGTMANQERSAVFFSKMYSEFMADIYEGFLSTDEIQDLKNGLEIYLNSEEIQERLDKRAELLEEDICDAVPCDDTCSNPENPCKDCYKLPDIILDEEEDVVVVPKKKPTKKTSKNSANIGSEPMPVVTKEQRKKWEAAARDPASTMKKYTEIRDANL